MGRDHAGLCDFHGRLHLAPARRVDCWLGLKEKGSLEVLKEFVGKTVGISARGSAVENQMRGLLVCARLSLDSVTYVAVGSPNTAYLAMLEKQIEAAVMWVSFQSICEAKSLCEIAVDMEKGEGPANLKAPNGAFATFAARRDVVKINKVSIDKFITAMGNGIEWMKKPGNFEKVREIAKKYTSLGDISDSDKILTDLVKSQIPSYSSKVDRQAIKRFANFLVDIKLTLKPFDTSKFVYEASP
jgi:NitT/TauT family transport system substrate-binding protein